MIWVIFIMNPSLIPHAHLRQLFSGVHELLTFTLKSKKNHSKSEVTHENILEVNLNFQ